MASLRLESQDPRFASRLFDGSAAAYDRVASACSFGRYGAWEQRLIDAARAHGLDDASEVLDVATGTGRIAHRMLQATRCRVTGLDLTRDMLRAAAARRGNNTEGHHRGLLQGTADALPFPDGRFDGLTFSYLYRYVPDPLETTRELLRVVRPGGFVGFIEFHVPERAALRALWRAHTRTSLPLVASIGGAKWRDIGRFLGPNIEAFYRDQDAAGMAALLQEAGCAEVDWQVMSLGGGLVMWGRKEDA